MKPRRFGYFRIAQGQPDWLRLLRSPQPAIRKKCCGWTSNRSRGREDSQERRMEKYIGKRYARNYRGAGPRASCRNLRAIPSRMKRTLRFLALIVVGLAIGAVSGVVHGRRSLGQGSEVLCQSFALAEYETLEASNIRRQTRPTQNKPFWIC